MLPRDDAKLPAGRAAAVLAREAVTLAADRYLHRDVHPVARKTQQAAEAVIAKPAGFGHQEAPDQALVLHGAGRPQEECPSTCRARIRRRGADFGPGDVSFSGARSRKLLPACGTILPRLLTALRSRERQRQSERRRNRGRVASSSLRTRDRLSGDLLLDQTGNFSWRGHSVTCLLRVDRPAIDHDIQLAEPPPADSRGDLDLTLELCLEAHGLRSGVLSDKAASYFDLHGDQDTCSSTHPQARPVPVVSWRAHPGTQDAGIARRWCRIVSREMHRLLPIMISLAFVALAALEVIASRSAVAP